MYLFVGLLALAFAAPTGLVLAGDVSKPFVVMFNDSAAGTGAAGPSVGVVPGGTDPASFRAQAASDAAAESGDDQAAADRVVRAVQALAAVQHIDATDIYANVGAFSANLTPGQQLALEQNPTIADVIPDELVQLDEADPAASGGGVRTVAHPDERVPPGVRRVGAGVRVVGSANGGNGVNADVAIIDTGIQRNHPDLNVVGGYNCTSRNPDKWDDNDGHGTHVSGIVGGTGQDGGVVGVAPGVRLWAVKVLDGHGFGWISWLVCGVNWVTAQRDPNHHNRPLFEVANMSISYVRSTGNDRSCSDPKVDMLHKAICRSIDAGIVYVVAAGNDGHDARRNRPAAYNEVITVAALADYDGRGGGLGKVKDSCPYWTGAADDTLANFSNYGPDVDFVAPGVCVLSTWIGSRYAYLSGTSMATPHVTGAVAVYRARYPRATPTQVRMALEAVGTLDWRTWSYPNDGPPPKAVWIGSFRTVPDFALKPFGPPTSARPGGTGSLAVAVQRIGGFSGRVTVTPIDLPSGFSVTPQTFVRGGGWLILQVSNRVHSGRYQVTVQGDSAGLRHTLTITVTVTRH